MADNHGNLVNAVANRAAWQVGISQTNQAARQYKKAIRMSWDQRQCTQKRDMRRMLQHESKWDNAHYVGLRDMFGDCCS